MPEPAAPIPPVLRRAVSLLARSLVAAVRARRLYLPGHPTAGVAVDRLSDVVSQFPITWNLSLGVTPETLLVDQTPLDPPDGPVAEAAALLHEQDILQLRFLAGGTSSAIASLVELLALDRESTRKRGGPVQLWEECGDPAIAIEQVDYQAILADHDSEAVSEEDLWRILVKALSATPPSMDEGLQRRLLEIATNNRLLGKLLAEMCDRQRTGDGAPMIASQAAAVVAIFRHIMSVASMMAPEQADEIANAMAATLVEGDPHLAVEALRIGGTEPDETRTMEAVGHAMGDDRLASLLVAAIEADGRASTRLAEVFGTLTPDDFRRRRVLALARSMLSERSFGSRGGFDSLWTSVEELLLGHSESPFVSTAYRASLDGVGQRGRSMAAAASLPDEMPEWLETVGDESLRNLSVTLLLDLLKIEREPGRLPEIARDAAALAEQMLQAANDDGAVRIATGLTEALAGCPQADRAAVKTAIDAMCRSTAFRNRVSDLGTMSDAAFANVRAFCVAGGTATIDAFLDALSTDEGSRGHVRATEIILGFKGAAVWPLARVLGHRQMGARRTAIRLLGRIGTPDAIAALQPLLRNPDNHVVREAAMAIAGMEDPQAIRAITAAVRAAGGAAREALVSALLGFRDRRTVPVLVRLLEQAHALGGDHRLVIDVLARLAEIGDDRAVPVVASLMWHGHVLAPWRTHRLRRAAVRVLAGIRTPASRQALADGARRGKFFLKRMTRAALAEVSA